MMILFISIFLVGIGFSIIMPILPYYAESMGASAFQLGLLMTVYALCNFIFAPFWGAYSDKVGRKPILLMGMIGFALTFFLFALADSLWMLFVARIAGGIFSCATIPTAMAYVGDTTSEEKRGASMGMVGASMGMGMIFGPAIGSGLAHISLAFPFLIAGVLCALNGLGILAFIKESLAIEKRSTFKGVHRESLLKGLQTPLAFLFIVMFFCSLAESINHGTFALYAEGKLAVGATDVGIVFTCAGIVMVLVQGLLVGRLINRIGEEKTAGAGIVILILGFAGFLMSTNLVGLIVFMGVFSGGIGLIRPCISAAVSKRTTMQQGTAMGILQGYDSLGRVIGPSLGGFMLDLNLSYAYSMAIAVSLAALLTLIINARKKAGIAH
jgi:DHA1 family multidrug resistance protein-like MFS transporter